MDAKTFLKDEEIRMIHFQKSGMFMEKSSDRLMLSITLSINSPKIEKIIDILESE